jgi:hypothetical protein
MTPQQLKQLPVGAKVLFETEVGEKGEPIFDTGEVINSGETVTIKWNDGLTNYIGINSPAWEQFISYITEEYDFV